MIWLIYLSTFGLAYLNFMDNEFGHPSVGLKCYDPHNYVNIIRVATCLKDVGVKNINKSL
jgi:hypothetical protein